MMQGSVQIYRRRLLEQHIEAMISLLDEIDGDENLEPDLSGFDPDTLDDREGDDERETDLQWFIGGNVAA